MCFITTNKQLWKSLIECFHLWHGEFLKLLLIFFPICFYSVLNKSRGHWIFSDALHSTISINLKLTKENCVLPSFENLMDDDSIVNDELSLLASNIRREITNVLDFFLSLLKVYGKKKAHDMISLMLDPRHKSLRIISSLVGREQGVALVEEYDRKTLYPMLVKCCHEHLHPLVRSETNFANQNIFYQDCILDIFEQTISTSEPVEELVQKGTSSF